MHIPLCEIYDCFQPFLTDTFTTLDNYKFKYKYNNAFHGQLDSCQEG